MELYIVRHGQSVSNAGIEKDDPELTELGMRQALLLGERFQNTRFDHIYASSLLRAAQTAAGAAKYQSAPVEIVPALVEAGTRADFVPDEAAIRRECGGVVLHEKEIPCPEDPGARAKLVLETLVFPEAYGGPFDEDRIDNNGDRIRDADKKILLVSHGVFIAHLLSKLVGFPFDRNMIVSQDNTCVNLLNLFLFNDTRRVRFRRFNDVRHLPEDMIT
ncbi:MAG: histidine phosphatase family protein [Clostridia bacterium]|nr:histidine phosphatase family protein [Clostridia bacterium]MBR5427778.1 histidine phosphatase family protein [Clostridia bacterium]